MSEPSPTEQSRAVCLALPEIGWKEGKKCKGCFDANYWAGAQPISHAGQFSGGTVSAHIDHDIPPPDLASPAGADLLMTACEARHFHIEQFVEETQSVCYLTEETVEPTHFVEGTGLNWRLALLDAAWRLLCEGK